MAAVAAVVAIAALTSRSYPLLALGALITVAVVLGSPRATRLLSTPLAEWLGRVSFSLYLVHLPIVVVVSRTLTGHHLVPRGLPLFLVTLAVAVPLALGFARLFAAVFEIPFQRHRGWPYPSVTRWFPRAVSAHDG